MDSDLQRPSDHAGINTGEQGEEHHQHKSVLKKVKDKAKKIKDTLKKHGHSHEHDQGDDETEETVNAPHVDVHGAPKYDSPPIKSPNLPRDTNINAGKQKHEQDFTHEGLPKPAGPITHEGLPKHAGPITHEGLPKPVTPGMITHEGLSKPVTPGPIKHDGSPKPVSPGMISHEGSPKPVTPGPIKHDGISRPAAPGPVMHGGTPRPASPGPIMHEGAPMPVSTGPIMHEGLPKPVSPVPLAEAFGKRPAVSARDKNSPQPKKKVGLEQDPHSPAAISKSNDQSKVADPTGYGGKEANVAPLLGQFGNLNVHDKKPEQEQSSYHTGTHDQFAPQKTPTKNLSNLDSNRAYTPETENPNPSPKIQDPTTITGKISAVATAAAGTAVSAKNAVASKLGYGGGPQAEQGYETGLRPGDENPDRSPKIQDKVSTAAISAKNTVASKLGYGGGPQAEQGYDTGLRPGDENPDLSPKTQDSTNQNTITEKMSTAAISAKNTVASKLGYGGGHQGDQGYDTGLRPEDETPDRSPKTQDSTNQNTITDKMSTAAISAKNVVASKLGHGGGPQTDQGYDTGLRPGDETPSPKIQDSTNQNTITDKLSAAATAASGTAVSAKNVVASKLGYGDGPQAGQGGESGTLKEYLGEKLRPGDEDKALSEVITGALSKKEDASVVEQPGSRVRVSPEVAARLGPAKETKREGDDALAAGAESSGPGVVDRLKDAVGSWLGKGDGVQTAQDSIEGSYVSDATTGAGAKRES